MTIILVTVFLPGPQDTSTDDVSAIAPAGGLAAGDDLASRPDGDTGAASAQGSTDGARATPSAQDDGTTDPGGGPEGAAGGGASGEAAFGPDCDTTRGRIKIPTLYAPPCQPVFGGDNGGDTWRGVSKDEIKLALYAPQSDPAINSIVYSAGGSPDSEEDVRQTWDNYVAFFNTYFETYGRTVTYEILEASGADDDDAAARADAIRAADDMGAFASLGSSVLTSAYEDELAARGVTCICSSARPIENYLRNAPHMFSFLYSSSQLYVHRAEYIGKRLAGRKAKFAGDPTIQAQDRAFGLIYLDTPDRAQKAGADFFIRELRERYGIELADVVAYEFDTAQAQEQARTIITRFQEKGVTSIIAVTDPFYLTFFTPEATQQQYFPEWVVTGSTLTDTNFFGRLYDPAQWRNAFGVSQATALFPHELHDAYRLHEWHFGSPPPASNFYTHQTMYTFLLQFFIGVHMAGPDLNPSSFRDGLFAYPSSGGGPTIRGLGWGTADDSPWRWDDYAPHNDITELWWDAQAVGPDENGRQGTGMYRWVAGGQRHLPGEWPASEAPVGDTSKAILTYDEIPPDDRPPDYEPKPRQ